MTTTDWSQWGSLQYRRRLERFSEDDSPVVATGPKGQYDAIWCAQRLLIDALF